MRLKRAIRMFFVVAALAAPVACGIDLLATGDDPVGDGAAPDGQATTQDSATDAADETTQFLIPPTTDPLLDAGLDVNQDNCLAACPEGGVASCDAGWCVFDCSVNNSCGDPGGVVCPPGIPCEVTCSGDRSCHKGVDCTAGSACRIHCTGDTSCDDAPVLCAGLGCALDCTGNNACHEGAGCDASVCATNCTGHSSCNNFVACTGDSCTLRCGDAGVDYNNEGVCGHSVTCDTTKLCDIGCVGDNTCRNEPLYLRSAGSAFLQCTGQDTCNHTQFLSGAEAGIACIGKSGNCGSEIFCDAGVCFSTCANGNDLDVCCKAPNPAVNCRPSTSGCKITAGDCVLPKTL